MYRLIFAALAIALLAPGVRAAVPGDTADGQRLHAANCGECHDAGVYTRKDRRVRSLDALKHQLQNCAHVAKKDFSPTETQNLLKFLNERYYHFE
jgi:cytochrome c553